MNKSRLPLLNRTGWIFIAVLTLVVAYLVIDRPVTEAETISGIVTHVYVSTPQYSVNAVRWYASTLKGEAR